jgi:hypothetical protein
MRNDNSSPGPGDDAGVFGADKPSWVTNKTQAYIGLWVIGEEAMSRKELSYVTVIDHAMGTIWSLMSDDERAQVNRLNKSLGASLPDDAE